MNGDGIVIPRIVGSKGGKTRRAPSSQPTYQSGCAGEATTDASNGPYSQMGLTWKSPPMIASTALARTGLFDTARLAGLADAHRSGRADHSRLLWQLLMLDRSLVRLGLAA